MINSISIIGGADGPTRIFIFNKVTLLLSIITITILLFFLIYGFTKNIKRKNTIKSVVLGITICILFFLILIMVFGKIIIYKSNKEIINTNKQLSYSEQTNLILTTDFVDDTIHEFEKNLGEGIVLIDNKDDQLKLFSALKSILELTKNSYHENKELKRIVYSKDDKNLTIGFKSGIYKGADGHYVKKYFFYESSEQNIHFYLTDDDYNIVINSGGKKENVSGFGSLESEYQFDYEPNRYYEINTINGNIKSGDFYWD